MNEHTGQDLKDAVRADWAARGEAWNRWAEHMAKMADRFNVPLLDAAGVGAGEAVLDLASGVGEPALSAARRVGGGGRVVATDLVPEMLAGARRRAADAGLDNLDFEITDMEDLPYPDDHFDRVLCRFGIMFAPRPEAALSEALRVLKPGGRAAYLFWGPRRDTTMFEAIWTAVEALLGPAEEVSTLTPFRFGEPGTMEAMMREAGFAEVEETEHRFEGEMPADEPFWLPQLEMSFAPRLAHLDEAQRAALETAVAEAFAPYRDGGVTRLAAHVRIASGVKAG